MIDFKGSQFEREIILWGVRWYVAYPISYRQLEEMMQERGHAARSHLHLSGGKPLCPRAGEALPPASQHDQ